MLSVATAQAEGRSTFTKLLFLDHFDKGVLDSGWRWVDPWDDSTLSFPRYSWLEIVATSGNDLQPKANLNAPRLIRPISGDFAIETRISPSRDGSFPSGGLLIWKDEENFIRFERGTWGFDTILLQKREAGLFQHVGDWFFRGNPIYLRMERVGSDFKALFSEDGRRWNEAAKFKFNLSDPLYVGLHAICFAADFPPTATDFDYFKILSTGNNKPYRIKGGNKLNRDELLALQKLEERKLIERANHVLSKTASEREALAGVAVITDPKTGVRFKKKLVDERLDVISNPYGVRISPDGRFLYDATEYWVVPLEEGEPFKLLSGFRWDILGRWSPDMKMFAFFCLARNSLWVVRLSPQTSKPLGPPKEIVKDVFKEEKMRNRSSPSWSPDSKWIAFSSDKAGNPDIWIVSPDGEKLTRLTDDPLGEFSPWWSPDGKSIIYSKRRPISGEIRPIYDIWIIPSEGGKAEKLIENAYSAGYSPDGEWIGFTKRRWSEKGWIRDVVLFRLSDRRKFEVTVPDEVWDEAFWSPDGEQVLFFKSGYDWRSSLRVVNTYGGPWIELGRECKLVAWDQVWTPDGEKIITMSDTDFWWIIPTKGGVPIKFQLRPEPRSVGFVLPSFSPDLTRSAYVSEDGNLWVLPISVDKAKAVGKPVKVGEGFEAGKPFFVSWSPDSKRIAFPSRRGGSRDIWIASVKGGKPRQLTSQPGDEPEPEWSVSWSPDSRWIAYSNKEGIWVIPSSGGEPRRLVGSEKVLNPAWSPDGEEIAFIGKSHISTVNPQTGEIKQILDLKAHNLDGEDAWNLVWSPDGEKLGFIGFKDPRYRIWIISISTGYLTELAGDDPGDKYFFTWSPDGRKVSYSSDRYYRVRTGAIWAMDVEELVRKTSD